MTPEQVTALSAPFPGTAISWRVGSTTKDKSKGMALAYIDARDVMARLDEVCGPGGWQCRYSHVGSHVVCDIAVKIGDEWVWKAGGAGATDVEAVKGSLSDALKRAAVLWGIGRYLYDLKSPWVALEQKGRSYVIAPSENAKLANIAQRMAGSVTPPAQPAAPKAGKGPDKRALYTELQQEIDACGDDADALDILAQEPSFTDRVKHLAPDWQGDIRRRWAAAKRDARDRQPADMPPDLGPPADVPVYADA